MADYASLHCAACKTDIYNFVNQVYYPGCRHVFCPTCFNAHYKQPTGKFICPVDFAICSSQSENSQQFFQAFQIWWSVANRMSRGDVNQCYQILLQCVNLTLFPCVLNNVKHNLERCPFDHSLQFAGTLSSSRSMDYCTKCKVFTKTNHCPRCNSGTVKKDVPARIKMTNQSRTLKQDLPWLKTISESQTRSAGFEQTIVKPMRDSRTISEVPPAFAQRRK